MSRWNAVTEGPAHDKTFSDLKHRWTRIELCLYPAEYAKRKPLLGEDFIRRRSCPDERNTPIVAKNVKRYYDYWAPFRDAWLAGDEDIPALSSQVSNVSQAESELKAGGGKPPDKSPTPSPDIEERDPTLSKADKAGQEAEKVFKEGLEEVVKPASEEVSAFALGTIWKAIPLPIKIASGLALAATGLIAVAPYVFAYRRRF